MYKQAPNQTYLTGGLVVYVEGFGAFSRILYFRVQIGTKINLFYKGFSCLWGSLVVYVYGEGLLDASCTSVYHKTAKKNTYHSIDSRLL